MISVGSWWLWAVFALVILVMLAIDLLVMGGGHRHKVSVKEAAGWSVAWAAVSMLFAAGLWYYLDITAGRELANDASMKFIAGYLLEKSLAVDNVFVWMIVFSFFAVPVELQRRVLLYGIVGALVLRAGMIFGGTWLINHFDWILYVFGAFLVFTGVKMLMPEDDEPADLQSNPFIAWLTKHLRLTDGLRGEAFFIREKGLLYATPLFLCLVVVEISDVVFAVDSIPAVFAVTTDPFLVLTSNIFAILGLRAMYFLLAGAADKLSLLKYGLAFIMVWVGTKMLIVEWFHVPVVLSLSVIASALIITVVASLWWNKRQQTQN